MNTPGIGHIVRIFLLIPAANSVDAVDSADPLTLEFVSVDQRPETETLIVRFNHDQLFSTVHHFGVEGRNHSPAGIGSTSLINGDFTDDVTGWTWSGSPSGTSGSVSVVDGEAMFEENDSFLVTLQQTFVIPAGVSMLAFDLISAEFDLSDADIPDAFEVHLLDGDNQPVVPPWAEFASSFFNMQEDGSVNLGANTKWDDVTGTVEVSGLVPGMQVTVYFDFIGADDDTAGTVIIDNVRLIEPVEPAVQINEIRIAQPGEDVDEYLELQVDPEFGLLDGLSYIVIGDSVEGGSGVVEAVVPLEHLVAPAGGRFVAGEATLSLAMPNLSADLNFEDGDNVTHLLVRNFSGLLGDDLDPADDGELDTEPWDEIIDEVAFVGLDEPGAGGDLVYSCTTIGPHGPGVPSHIYRCDLGDESPGDWTIGATDPAAGTDTPGFANLACGGALCPADLDNTGSIGATDLAFLLGGWGPCLESCEAQNPSDPCPADFNNDDAVGASDLAQLLGTWGPCTCEEDIECDDGVECTVDSCTDGVCLNDPVDQDIICDDGDACTTDVCVSAIGCENIAIECDEGQICIDGVCQ